MDDFNICLLLFGEDKNLDEGGAAEGKETEKHASRRDKPMIFNAQLLVD